MSQRSFSRVMVDEGLVLTLVLSLSVSLAFACGRVSATREFNYGIKYYGAGNYSAAVRSFERATEGFEAPEPWYDLALAQLALVREQPSRDAIDGGLNAVTRALELAEDSQSFRKRLHFIAGEIHRSAGELDLARDAYARALEVDRSYAPALRGLVMLEPDADALLVRFVLATATVEAPQLETTLPP